MQRWGEPRLTRDADLTVFTGIGDERSYVDELLARFAARIDNARDFALQHRVLLLRAGIDVEGVIARSAPLIDWPTVDAQLQALLDLKGDDSALTRLLAVRERLGAR